MAEAKLDFPEKHNRGQEIKQGGPMKNLVEYSFEESSSDESSPDEESIPKTTVEYSLSSEDSSFGEDQKVKYDKSSSDEESLPKTDYPFGEGEGEDQIVEYSFEESSSDVSSSDEESPPKTTVAAKQTPVKKRKVDSSSYSVDDVEMPVASHTALKRFIPACAKPRKARYLGSKTKTVRVLLRSHSHVKLSDLVNILKGAGEIVSVWFALDKYQVFKRYGFVTFETAEAARKALHFSAGVILNDIPISIELDDCDSRVQSAQQSRVQMDESERKSFKKKRISGEQSAINESHGPMGGSLESPQVKHKRVKKMHVSRVQKGMDAPPGFKHVTPDHYILYRAVGPRLSGEETIVSFERKFAKIALKFYEKRLGAKFKVLGVLFSNRALLAVPGFGLDRLWCHVSFIAKPRYGCSACDSPKHFFGEMVYNCATEKYDVNFCSIFEPSDPANIEGCVFCPPNPIFVHPAHGCPAGGREIDKFTAQKQMDASQGQIGGCSKLHPERPYIIKDEDKNEQKYFEVLESLRYGYAKIALEFYEKREGSEFEIVDIVSEEHSPVVVPGSERLEEWCEVRFKARPRNVDRSYVPPQHFTGELLRDVTTGKYNATYCETFKPVKHTGYRTDEERHSHPATLSSVDQYTIPEFTEYLVDMSDLLTPNRNKT